MKFSKYTNIIEFDGGILVHNSLYNSSLKIYSEDKINQLKEIKESDSFIPNMQDSFILDLMKLHIILEEDINETNTMNYFYDQRTHNIGIILVVTSSCNFRCPYCIQDHESNRMSDDIYTAARNFLKTLVSKYPGASLNISFFGGEPLLEKEKIINFMNDVKSDFKENEMLKNTQISGQITTNGYLLDLDSFQKLVDVGVTNYQITVDGLQKTHDKGRYLVNKVGTWTTIINNLRKTRKTKLDFEIQIRTNYTEEILKNFDEYLDFIENLISNDQRYTLHFEDVKDYGTLEESDDIGIVQPIKSSEFIFNKMKGRSIMSNLDKLERRMHCVAGLVCYAADPSVFTFDVDGTIRKCTFDLEDNANIVGQVINGSVLLNSDQMARWTNYDTYNSCKECNIYPVCYGKKCPKSYPNLSPRDCELARNIYVNSLKQSYLS